MKPGRKPYQPTEAVRAIVRDMAGFGMPHDAIAARVGISDETLRKYYGDTMHQAPHELNVKVAQEFYWNATKGRNVQAQIAWLKMRAGWREPVHHELTGKDGEAIMLVTGVVRDVENQNEAAPVRRIGTYDIEADAAD